MISQAKQNNRILTTIFIFYKGGTNMTNFDMNDFLNTLTPQQRAAVLECRTEEELEKVIDDQDIDIPDELLEEVAGGKGFFPAVMASVIMLTTGSTIIASAESAGSATVTSHQMSIVTRDEPSLNGANVSITAISNVATSSGDVIASFAKSAFGFVSRAALTNITNRFLNMGLDTLFSWVFGNKDISNTKLKEAMDKRFDKVDEKLGAIVATLSAMQEQSQQYHTEDINYFLLLNSQIKNQGFKDQVDKISSDIQEVLNHIDQHSDGVTTNFGDKLDKDTYDTYKKILGYQQTSCENLQSDFDSMVNFIIGNKYVNDKCRGYEGYADYIVKDAVAADTKHGWNDAVDYNAVYDYIESEIRAMEHDLITHYYLALAERYMQCQVEKYENVSNAEKSCEKYVKQMTDGLSKANEYFENVIEKLHEQRDQTVRFEVTAVKNGKTVIKGYKSFAQAWSCAVTADADTTITTKESSIKLDLPSGYNGISADSYENANGHIITLDLQGKTSIDCSGKDAFAIGSKSGIIIKNGTLTNAKNMMTVCEKSQNVTCRIDNVKTSKISDAVLVIGQNTNADISVTNCDMSAMKNVLVASTGIVGELNLVNCSISDISDTGLSIAASSDNFKLNLYNTVMLRCSCSAIIDYSSNEINIDNCQFIDNHQTGRRWGGAICTIDYDHNYYGNPMLNIKNSTFFRNECRLANSLYVPNGRIGGNPTYNRSAGGAICARRMNIDHCTFDSNCAPGWGGAIYIPLFDGAHYMGITNCLFINNTAPMTVYNDQNKWQTFIDGYGAAVCYQNVPNGRFKTDNNVFANNKRDFYVVHNQHWKETKTEVYNIYHPDDSSNKFTAGHSEQYTNLSDAASSTFKQAGAPYYDLEKKLAGIEFIDTEYENTRSSQSNITKIEEGKHYIIKSANSSLVLTLSGSSDTVQQTYDGSSYQKWTFEKLSDGSYHIKNVGNSSRVLDVRASGKDNGTQVIAYTNHNTSNQAWDIRRIGACYVFVNRCSSKVLDVPGASKNSGQTLHQWDFNYRANQMWYVEAVD